MKLKLFFTFYILFIVKIISAETYYINPKNGLINNTGTLLNPWNKLDDVLKCKKINDGDTLFLFTGYHGDNIEVNEKYKNYLVIKAYKCEIPIVTQIKVSGKNIILDGITFSPENKNVKGISRFYDNGVLLKLDTLSKNIIVQNCNFESIRNSEKWEREDWRKNVWSGIRDFGKNNIIRNNKLNNIAYAIELNETCKNSIVENNRILNFSGDGIRIGGADSCLIQFNLIEQSIELDDNPIEGNHEDGIQAWVDPRVDTAISNVIIHGNFIKNYSSVKHKLSGVLQGIGFFDGPYRNVIIENNIVIVEHFHGISLFGAYDSRITNNSVLAYPNTFPYIAGPPWIQISPHKNGESSKRNIVNNNLVANMLIEESSSTLNNNLVDPVAFKFVENYDSLNLYPKKDFIYGGRSIIDNGSNQNIPVTDFLKNKRIIGSSADIGAIEYNKQE